ncbi:leucyl aminopeptidase [Armillaria luteobubalina]|uniref:Aminopeptidase n=1 Tax=Armillaria luteobubalina TaxID=153913 RepID=A0AA39TXF4_9AGAR|nr:leucyl aminopeptidase [Armillaria luteobubalina]
MFSLARRAVAPQIRADGLHRERHIHALSKICSDVPLLSRKPNLTTYPAQRCTQKQVTCGGPGHRSHLTSALLRPSFQSSIARLLPPLSPRNMSTVATADPNRLPTNVKPTHYDVTIRTDLENLTFEGFVIVSLDIKEETSTIVLNSADLSFEQVSLTTDTKKERLVPTSQAVDGDRISFTLPTSLPAGSKAELSIGPYTGPLGNSMTGYYRSEYKEGGKTKHYSLTQFEPIDARRAFPCWDEPLLKATFAITMISHADTVNLSNMPSNSEKIYVPGNAEFSVLEEKFPLLRTLGGEWKVTTFDTTPPMSSYIVAFANGPFSYLESSAKMPSGKTVALRIYATSDLIHQAQFALDVKEKVLPLYEEVFGVEYPLPKLDTLVASDFDMGAMENWGLITGRTTAFLLDPNTTDTGAKKQVFTTQSHEMGEVIIAVFPEFKPKSDFIGDHLNQALALDAKRSSHPIEVECPTADHINQIFDSLSYAKAASEARFLKGVSIYLQNKLYGNGTSKDLWEGISKATGLDIVSLMENWVTKIGFPVLTVTETPTGIQDFALDTSKPFKLNAGTAGVYRVLYTPERLSKIADEAAQVDSPFSVDDRMGLVYDAMALSKAGLSKLSSALTLVDKLRNEKEFLIVDVIASNLSGLVSTWWEYPEIVGNLNAFRRSLFVPLVKELGYDYSDGEATDIIRLRTTVITNAALAGDESVINELRARFDHFRKTGDDSRIPPGLQRVTYQMAVKYGGREEYDAVKQIQLSPRTPTSKTAAIIALGHAQDPALIKETFEYLLSSARDQDFTYWLRGLSTNPKSKRQVAQFFKDEYQVIYKRFELNATLKYLVEISFGSLSTTKDYEETEAFFKDKEVSKYSLSLAQTLDTIRARVGYIGRATEDLAVWLSGWRGRTDLGKELHKAIL